MAMLPKLSIDEFGNQLWLLDGGLHKEDGPAVIRPNGYMAWYGDDKLHREDGPAVIYTDGSQFWYVNGKRYFTNKEYQSAAQLSDQDMTVIILTYGNVT